MKIDIFAVCHIILVQFFPLPLLTSGYTQGSENIIIEEENLNLMTDSTLKVETDTSQFSKKKQSNDKLITCSIGFAYAPMLWIKEGYYDAFAIPHGIFDNFNPWFFSAGIKPAIKPHNSRISFGIPVWFIYNRNSSNRKMLILSNDAMDFDSLHAKQEAVDRSHFSVVLSIGACVSVEVIKIRNFSILLEPEVAFVGGLLFFKIAEMYINYYYKNQLYWYWKKKSEKSIIAPEYAPGAKISIGLCLKYKINQKLSIAFSPYFSRLWSSVFRNKDQGAWIVSGIDGDKYEVRLNSLVYGSDLRIYIHANKKRN